MNGMLKSMQGAWHIMKFDRQALTYFQPTSEEFLKSFRVLLLALPLFLLAMYFQNKISLRYNGESFAVGLALLDYIIRWATYLAFAYIFGRILNISHNFIGFAIVFNWVKLWLVLIPLPILALTTVGLFDSGLYSILALTIFLYAASVQIFTLHIALGATLLEAIGIYLAGFLTDRLVQAFLSGI